MFGITRHVLLYLQQSMVRSTIVVFLLLHCYHHATANTCICNRHKERELYPCPNYSQPPTAYLYADNDDDRCIYREEGVIEPHGWFAGIYSNPFTTQIVYIKADFYVQKEACTKSRPKGPITYDHQCTRIKPGASINPATTTSTTISTTKTTTTTTTTTTTPKSTTTSTTQSTTSTTRTTIKTTPKPPTSHSNKCDYLLIQQHVTNNMTADHGAAKPCPDGSHASMEALLYKVCRNIELDFTLWKQEKKVLDHCSTIPRGEPLAYYVFGYPAGIFGIFWSCLPGNSFEIAVQNCGSPVKTVDIATLPFGQNDNFYTVSW